MSFALPPLYTRYSESNESSKKKLIIGLTAILGLSLDVRRIKFKNIFTEF